MTDCIPTSIEGACLQAVERFDFDKAASIYEALGWRWRDGGVPDRAKIRAEARALCAVICRSGGETYKTSTGGLTAVLEEGECGWEVRIEFVAVHGTSDDFERPNA